MGHGNTTAIAASELSVHTRWILAVDLVGAILAVVLVIALPGLEYTTAIVAAELVGRAGVVGTVVGVFVGVVAAVIVAIAGPHARDALAILAVELAVFAGVVARGAHAALVHQLGVVVALAFGLAVRRRMTALSTASIVDVARIDLA